MQSFWILCQGKPMKSGMHLTWFAFCPHQHHQYSDLCPFGITRTVEWRYFVNSAQETPRIFDLQYSPTRPLGGSIRKEV